MGFLTWSGLFNYLKPADASHPLENKYGRCRYPSEKAVFFAGAKGFCVKSLVEYLSNPAVPVGFVFPCRARWARDYSLDLVASYIIHSSHERGTILSNIIILIVAICMFVFRKKLTKKVAESQSKAWGFRFSETDIRITEAVIILCSFGALVLAVLAMIGTI